MFFKYFYFQIDFISKSQNKCGTSTILQTMSGLDSILRRLATPETNNKCVFFSGLAKDNSVLIG